MEAVSTLGFVGQRLWRGQFLQCGCKDSTEADLWDPIGSGRHHNANAERVFWEICADTVGPLVGVTNQGSAGLPSQDHQPGNRTCKGRLVPVAHEAAAE